MVYDSDEYNSVDLEGRFKLHNSKDILIAVDLSVKVVIHNKEEPVERSTIANTKSITKSFDKWLIRNESAELLLPGWASSWLIRRFEHTFRQKPKPFEPTLVRPRF